MCIKVRNIRSMSLPLICGGFMGINHINNRAKINPNGLKYIPETKTPEVLPQDRKLIEELDKMSMINNVNITNKKDCSKSTVFFYHLLFNLG